MKSRERAPRMTDDKVVGGWAGGSAGLGKDEYFSGVEELRTLEESET